ncbi:MAG: hypothetical protein ABSE73_02430, partial [Planctomycetota bacterium]
MAKKKKIVRNEAQNQLKTLESKWLKDRRLAGVDPVQARVCAAKAAALLDYAEQNKQDVDPTMWPLNGVEELVRMDEDTFRQALKDLQDAGILTPSFRFCKVAAAAPSEPHGAAPKGGLLHYRCVKPGGVNITDRDEYIMEEQEVVFTEEDIGASPGLQTAIAN